MGSGGGRGARKNNPVHRSVQDLVLNREAFQQSSLVRLISYQPRRLAGPLTHLLIKANLWFFKPHVCSDSHLVCQDEDNLSVLAEPLAQQCCRGTSAWESLLPGLDASGEVFCRRQQTAGQMVNAQAYSQHTSYPTPPGKIVSKQTQKF